jgi:putative phosphoesterase
VLGGLKVGAFSILVISDSHGDITALSTVLAWAKNTALDAAVFLGDGADDLPVASAQARFSLPWHMVRGNGDYDFFIPDNIVMEIPPSRKIFLSHGNRLRVREGKRIIANAALSTGASAALFGHTHIPYCDTVDNVFLLNPGSISRPRSDSGRTFAVLECSDSMSQDDTPFTARFYTLDRSGIKQLDL